TGMADLGAYIIRYQNVDSEFITGFLMVQGANICFALGQSAYKKVMESNPNIIHRDVFGYFYFGALLVGIVAFALLSDHSKLSPTLLQWSVLLWLGIVASGIGYFLWNKGACDVDAGVLGIMNNALVPAGLMMNLLLWKTPVDYVSLSIGSGIILFSLVLHYRLINRKHAL
uniref:EamA family transporter n=1 Tax=Sulfurospirillum cavolei TaxID=366522 RepID=UPI003FA2A0E4